MTLLFQHIAALLHFCISGKLLEQGRTLADYGVQPGDSIDLILPLPSDFDFKEKNAASTKTMVKMICLLAFLVLLYTY